jgi:RNA polymerase sigma-70 factor, ECF subfamily
MSTESLPGLPGLPGLDDAELAARAAGGDADAMGVLLERHFDFLHAVCRRVLADPAAAEDARQEVLFRIARSIRSFDQRSSFRTWAFVIARRVALDAIRSRDRAPVPDQAVIERAGTERQGRGSGVDNVVAARVDIDAALRVIPAERREVVVLRYLCDQSYEEIAQTLGVPLNTVRSRLRRGLADLRGILGNFPGPDGVQAGKDGQTLGERAP